MTDLTSNLVSGLTKLGNSEGQSWVTLREAEAAAVCAELSKLHAEHLQDVERMDRAATAIEACGDRDERWRRVVLALSEWENTPRMNAIVALDAIRMAVLEPLDRPAVKTSSPHPDGCDCANCDNVPTARDFL